MKIVALGVALALTDCSGSGPQLNPGGAPVAQNVTFAPVSSQISPITVNRNAVVPAVITAALATHNVNLSTNGGNCVTLQIPGGFIPGGTTYSFTIAAVANAPANCAEMTMVTVDGTAATYYVLVP